MKIIKDPKFNEEFKVILRFIALDSKIRAINFKNELISKVNDLPYMPYKYRKSHYFSDDNIRGYIIPYLGIIKYKEKS